MVGLMGKTNKSEDRGEEYKKLNDKMEAVERISKELESSYSLFKEQSTHITKDLTQLDKFAIQIKEIVDMFEKTTERDKEHTVKTFVAIKVSMSSLEGEFKFFKKEFEQYMKNAKTEIRNSKLNKENIDANFRNIVNSFSVRINQIHDEVSKMKDKQQAMAQPLVE